MSDDNDAAVRLLARITAGEEAAMGGFYGRFSRQVYAFALRSCGRPEEAEDVVVEAMYEVWKSAGRFTGGSQVRTWLFSIARHKLIDRMRRAGPRHAVELDDVADGLADEDAGAFERLARTQTRCAEALHGAALARAPRVRAPRVLRGARAWRRSRRSRAARRTR